MIQTPAAAATPRRMKQTGDIGHLRVFDRPKARHGMPVAFTKSVYAPFWAPICKKERGMAISRRQFLKGSGLTAGALALTGKPAQASADAPELRTKGLQTSTTICPYCAVGCGMIVSTKGGKIVNIEGDPEHPINRGALCSKGSALFQVANNERRLTKVQYRAPGSNHWEEKSWGWAMDRIARLMQESRDRNFVRTEVRNGQEYVVNRNEGMAFLGAAALDNEECYLWGKFARAMGVAYLEHQARI
jgi:formate dehydrogenase major subunit